VPGSSVATRPASRLTDVTASYLTILHGLEGHPFDPSSDPYVVPGIDREIVKLWTVATLGTGHLKRWPKRQRKKYEEEHGKKFAVTVAEIRAAMEKKHPVFLTWDDQKITWADLMFAESEAILGTMLTLMDEHGVPSLCVHDSLIVGRPHLALAKGILEKRYQHVCGIKPVLKDKGRQPAPGPSLPRRPPNRRPAGGVSAGPSSATTSRRERKAPQQV